MSGNSNINLGRKGQFGNVNFNQMKGGIKKAGLNAEQIKLFEKFDTDRNGILDEAEMQNLTQSLGAYAKDGKITKHEAGKYFKEQKLDIKNNEELFNLLKNFGIASDGIENFSEDDNTMSIQYKATEDGQLTEVLDKATGKALSKTTVKDGKTLEQILDESGNVAKETTTEGNKMTVVEYDESGNWKSTTVKQGTVTQVLDEDGKVLKQETDKGNGVKETVENEYDDSGNLKKVTTKNTDGTVIVEDKEAKTKTTTKDGLTVIENTETGEKTIYKDNKDITQQMNLKAAFSNGKAAVTIDGKATGLTNKETYTGEIRLLKNAQIEDGKFPATLKMTLPAGYNGTMELTLIDAEKGIYETKAKDRNFQVVVGDDGNVSVKSVNTEALKSKLEENQAEYARIAKERANAANQQGEESTVQENNNQVKEGASLTNKKVAYQVDSQGSATYINTETGETLSAEERTAFVKAEATLIADKLYDASKGIGTKNKQFKEAIGEIYSPEILQLVNEQLKTKGYKEIKEGDTVVGMPIEYLILDEQSRSDALKSFKTLVNNGVMTSQEAARTIKRELEYEVDGGLGITRTAKVDEIMMLCPNRETRLELENQFAQDTKHKNLKPDEGSLVRAYLAADGWKPDEVDRFDANWVKNNSYTHEHDQEHRNGVIGRLAFEHSAKHNNENLKTALGAVDTESEDYAYFSQRAAQENEKAGYKPQFTGQDPVQQYIAGKTSDKGTVDAGEVSACNTLMYKGVKPINIQAQEALYEAKNGNLSHLFNSMDSELYTTIEQMVANGEVPNCKSLQDAYNQVMSKTIDAGEKARIQANAILSGKIEFSDDKIADFCIELMHSIDHDRGQGSSTGISAEYTNNADYKTVQLKAILQNNPKILADVKSRVEKENFLYGTTKTTLSGGTAPASQSTSLTDTKADYLQILADTKTIADEPEFLDENGNKITDQNVINYLQATNMKSLDAMREYVAQLEREFKLGVDAEGVLSGAANAMSRHSGLGTDRGDVATKYNEAKVLLDQLEAAAQGKLRDSEGNVVSVQDLAQQLIDKENELAQTNSDYKTTIQVGKMGIVMAPVIAVTAVASGGASLAGLGTVGAAAVSGAATAAATYGVNALEYNTSHTGNTAAARENNLTESLINGGTVFIGAAQMKYVSGMLNNAQAFVRGGGRLATVVASDIGVDMAGQYVQTGQISVEGVLVNAVFSVTGNLIGIKSLAEKAPANVPHVDVEVDPTFRANIDGPRDFVADGNIARNIDQSHLSQKGRDIVAEGLADISTEADVTAFRSSLGEAPTPQQRIDIDLNNARVAEANAKAHQIGDNIPDDVAARLRSQTSAAPASASTVSPEIRALENDIKGLDGSIKRLEQQVKHAKNKQPLEAQLEKLKQQRTAKAAELEVLQRPAVRVSVEVSSQSVKTARENVGAMDLDAIKNDLEANGIKFNDLSNRFKNGNQGISFSRDGVEYYMIYDKTGKCTMSQSRGNGTSITTNFENGKPVSESVKSYTGANNAQVEMKRTEFNADGSKTVYDFSSNKKISYDIDGKPISETPLKTAAKSSEHKLTPEEIAIRNADNERLRVELGEPSSLSDSELASELKRLNRTRRRFDKNGVEIETNHTRRKNAIIAEMERRGLNIQDGGAVRPSSAVEINENEFVRVAGNNGKPINENYVKASKDLRRYYNEAIESGKYTGSYQEYVETIQNAHKIAYAGNDGTSLWYNQGAGQGNLEINPGQVRGKGILRSNRTEEGMMIESVAIKYGDAYRTDGSSKVRLEGIADEALPSNLLTQHYYPDGQYMDQYFRQMHRTSEEALNLIQKGASETEILAKLAEHYQYAANARPFGQINNSLFMNELNTMLQKAGMKTMPHGMLDHAAQRLQPDAFKRYFIDEYFKTALS